VIIVYIKYGVVILPYHKGYALLLVLIMLLFLSTVSISVAELTWQSSEMSNDLSSQLNSYYTHKIDEYEKDG